jgi:large subunit ribosomal protein L16
MNLKLPQNLKFKRYSKKFIYSRGYELRSCFLFMGSSCGLIALESGRLTIPQIRTCISLLHKGLQIKKKSRRKVFCSVIIRSPLTEKSMGSRMGRGKGSVSQWVCYVKKGRILFQIQNCRRFKLAFFALRQISYKLPILTKIVLKHPLFLHRYSKNLKLLK